MDTTQKYKTIVVSVPMETALKLKNREARNFLQKSVDGICRFNIPSEQMADEPATDKVMLSFQCPVSVVVRMDKQWKKMSMESRTEFILHRINEGIKGVSLTPEDYEEIARQIRENEKKREARRRKKRNN
jgi:hypothetical protein